MTQPFDSVLIANRGLVARRIARSCRELGLRVIMVYTPDDLHPELLTLADQLVEIPNLPEASGYLNQAALVAAAQAHNAALHPGYGFLSESAALAQACQQAGVTFVGPDVQVLALSGDKNACAQAMRAAGLPLLPGLSCHDASPETCQALLELGLPLLLKPAQGGGGMGMQLVQTPEALPDALQNCLEQARRLSAAGSVLAERWLPAARHIEVQLLADATGRIETLSERDCSLQRRRQKVVEESPAPGLQAAQRATLFALARQAAAALKLDQVATAEFLWDGQQFWFLELNPRLQVEHGVTEMLTGLDLVACQLCLAQGQTLEQILAGFLPQLSCQGHAIEARLYAEQPWSGLPAAGEVQELKLPDGHGLRLELGVYAGMQVSSRFDPLLLKIIAQGPDRERARLRLLQALQALTLTGDRHLATNQASLLQALQAPDFVRGHYDTQLLESLQPPADAAPDESLRELLQGLTRWQQRPLPNTAQTGYWRPAFWK